MSSQIESPEEKKSRSSGIMGLFFVGCLLISIAIGIATGEMAVAFMIGLGVGFIAMGIARYVLVNGDAR